MGRARSKGKVGYVPELDERHYLFREYIRVLDRLRPAAFVMENVKGMLSSTVESRLVFEMLMEDLASSAAAMAINTSCGPFGSKTARPACRRRCVLRTSSCAPKSSAFRSDVIG